MGYRPVHPSQSAATDAVRDCTASARWALETSGVGRVASVTATDLRDLPGRNGAGAPDPRRASVPPDLRAARFGSARLRIEVWDRPKRGADLRQVGDHGSGPARLKGSHVPALHDQDHEALTCKVRWPRDDLQLTLRRCSRWWPMSTTDHLDTIDAG